MFAARTRSPVPWCAARTDAARPHRLRTYCGRPVARNWVKVAVTEMFDPLDHEWCAACWRIVGDTLTKVSYAQRQGGPAIARSILETLGLLEAHRPARRARMARPTPAHEELTT